MYVTYLCAEESEKYGSKNLRFESLYLGFVVFPFQNKTKQNARNTFHSFPLRDSGIDAFRSLKMDNNLIALKRVDQQTEQIGLSIKKNNE